MDRLIAWENELWSHKNLILLSLALLGFSLLMYHFAGNYVDESADTVIKDIILDNIPPIDLSFIYLYGFILTIAILLLYPLFYKVKYLHVVISQFSLLILIRTFFIILTHMKVPSGAILVPSPSLYKILVFDNDLFFSAHTSIPFLGMLLYKNEKIKIFFFFMTLILAVTVLVMHLHYSIDVFAAIFITYGSYKLGNSLFKRVKDKKEFNIP